MANTTLTTIEHRTDRARAFIDDVGVSPYYFFTADHSLPENSNVVEDVQDTILDTFYSVYSSMIYGKKISSNAVSLVIRDVPYQTGVVYEMYDANSVLHDKDYYVTVNVSSNYHVFKCLDNNMGANSTIAPNFSDIVGSNTTSYQTSDGYRWKYMYSFTDADRLKFATADYIPVSANADVVANAVPGAIAVTKIEETGRGYGNYLTGSFVSNDIMVDGQTTVFAVSNSAAKTSNGFYTGCYLYLTTGVAAGQYREIVDYISNPNGNFVVVDSFFDVSPDNGTNFEINPKVEIIGSGTETVNATGRALINATASNSVYRVEMFDYGRDYTYATARVIANAAVGVLSNAYVRPILSPNGGHGSDPATELGCREVVISTTLANTESNTVPSVNSYRRVGIIKSPKFTSAQLTMDAISGAYLPGEVARNVTMLRVKYNTVMTLANTTLTANTGDFREQFEDGQEIIVRNDDTSLYLFTSINSVVNSSTLTITDEAPFSASNASIFIANTIGTGVVSNTVAQVLTLSNVDPNFISGSMVIGESSGAFSTVNTVARSGVVKQFDTFVQLNKYVGSMSFGQFSMNEEVTQGDSSALLHSFSTQSGTTTIYTSNQVGQFTTGNTIVGELSAAVMSVSAKYPPELIFGSGSPIYIENLSPITRTPLQSEVFKTTLHF